MTGPLPDYLTPTRAARELGTTLALIEANIRAGRIRAEQRPDAHGRTRTLIPATEISRLLGEDTAAAGE